MRPETPSCRPVRRVRPVPGDGHSGVRGELDATPRGPSMPRDRTGRAAPHRPGRCAWVAGPRLRFARCWCVGTRVGPLVEQGEVGAFDLAVGLRSVGPDLLVGDTGHGRGGGGIRWASLVTATVVPPRVAQPSWSWLTRGDQTAAVGCRSRRWGADMQAPVHIRSGKPAAGSGGYGYFGVIARKGDDRW